MLMPSWDRERVLDLARSYQQPLVLAAAVESNVFDAIDGQRRTAEQLAEALGADRRALTMLLDALASIGLLAKEEGQYSLPGPLRDMLTSGGRDSILPALRHLAILLPRWASLAEVVRTGVPYTKREGYEPPPGALEAFIKAMHNFATPEAMDLVGTIDLRGVRTLLDVGGGPGTYTLAFCAANPGLSAILFDRPQVLPIARPNVEAAGLADRVTLVGGDFYTDELPGGADAAWVSAIIHMNSPQQNRELYAKVRRALNDGGRILIRDQVMDPTHTEPRSGALFAINMLVSTAGGGTYSFDEIRADLEAAGFRDARLLQGHAEMNCVVQARK